MGSSRALAAAVLGVALCGADAGRAEEILFIQSQQVFATLPEAQALEADLRQAAEALQAEGQAQAASLDSDLAHCRELARKERRAEAEACSQRNQMDRAEAQESFSKKEATLQERRRSDLTRMMERVARTAEDIRIERGAAVVMDLSVAGSPVMAYDESRDISGEVVERLSDG